MIEEYISFTGNHIKKLTINTNVKVDPMIVLKLLNMLPNLKCFVMKCYTEPDVVTSNTKWELKSTKIESFCLNSSTAGFEYLLESLEKCKIKELELEPRGNEAVAVRKFLKAQEKNLKKLTIKSDFDYLSDLKDLRLEYLYLLDSRRQTISMEFLRYQYDLKNLSLLCEEFTRGNFTTICQLKNLETLRLESERIADDDGDLRDLYKLTKLKKLVLSEWIGLNMLEHIRLGVWNDLEELVAYFDRAPYESFQELNRNAPNLKKLKILSTPSDIIEAFLGNLESLETVEIYLDHNFFWTLPGKVCPQIKHLDINTTLVPDFTAEQFTKAFPNLEFFKSENFCIDEYSNIELTESFFVTLLSGLKQLKGIFMKIFIQKELKLDGESLLRCFKKHEESLEYVEVHFRYPELKNSFVIFYLNQAIGKLDISQIREITHFPGPIC